MLSQRMLRLAEVAPERQLDLGGGVRSVAILGGPGPWPETDLSYSYML